jgi:hypothetical protein
MYKSVNPTMKSKGDWSAVDLESLPASAIPVTAYKPAGSRTRYDADYDHWNSVAVRARYRIAWRCMAANVGERTLIPAVIPPGAAHVDGIFCAGFLDEKDENLGALAGFLSSIIADFSIRSAPKGHIRAAAINRLPVIMDHPLRPSLVMRTLRLNCISGAYADLWRNSYRMIFNREEWAGGRSRPNRPALGAVISEWTPNTPLRIAEDRRQALVEVDSLVALMLGVTADQLCAIYRTQFPVLYGYDHKDYVYDSNGRLVPYEVLSVWRKKGDEITGAELTATNHAGHTYIYKLPFRLLDREADMQAAYAEFERRLAAL